jgi:predicted DNA-binding protein
MPKEKKPLKITFRLSQELYNQVILKAKKEHLTESSIIREALEKYFETSPS